MSGKRAAPAVAAPDRARGRTTPRSLDDPALKALSKAIVARAREAKRPLEYFTERLERFLDDLHRPARKYTPGEVVEALIAGNGIRASAAQILGCNVGTIDEYRERYPEVEAEVQHQRSLLAAVAVSQLVKNVQAGDTQSTIYLLNNLARSEGYGAPTKHELTGKDGSPLVPTPPPSVRVVIEGGPQEVDKLPEEAKKP